MALNNILPGKLGFGAAPLGNMFRNIPEAEALATVEAAWNDGIRYFDNAPFYGAGLAEIRMGRALAGKPRRDYVISTKVGRIVLDEIEGSPRDYGEKGGVFAHGRPNKVVNDYSEDATYRSIEDSLKPGGMLREVAAATGRRIVFFCAYGERSAMAVKSAQAAGLANTAHIEGGLDAWRKAGGPVEQ